MEPSSILTNIRPLTGAPSPTSWMTLEGQDVARKAEYNEVGRENHTL